MGSEMTHKNPELRAGRVVKAKESSPKPKSTPSYGKAVAADKPSRFELDGKKWVVEYMKDNPSVNISDAQPNQTVYIYKCTGTTVKIQGKVNEIPTGPAFFHTVCLHACFPWHIAVFISSEPFLNVVSSQACSPLQHKFISLILILFCLQACL